MKQLAVKQPAVRHRAVQSLLVQRFVALHRTVANLSRATAFYCDGLGFRVVAANPDRNTTTLALGAEQIELLTSSDLNFRAPRVPGWDVRFQHAAIVARDIDAAVARLQSHLTLSPISCGGVQTLPPASGGVRAFKFRDSEGHPLELIEFPAGTGAARWSTAPGMKQDQRLTLGIDHIAISVSQVERSVAFYRRLGLRVASRQLNRGIEQARLDGDVDLGAEIEVDVVALQPCRQDSPHLELLGYHTPSPCCDVSEGVSGADLLVWQASNLPQRLADTLLHDPDGHCHQIVG